MSRALDDALSRGWCMFLGGRVSLRDEDSVSLKQVDDEDTASLVTLTSISMAASTQQGSRSSQMM